MLGRLATAFDPATALRRFNRFAAYFAANFRFGHTLFAHLCRAVSLQEAAAVLARFLDASPEIVARPRFEALGR